MSTNPTPEPAKNILCPDCDTENAPDATECKNPECGLSFAALKKFQRLAAVTNKQRKKEAEQRRAANPPTPEPEKKKGFWDDFLD